MTADFNVRKIYRAVERMDACEYSLEIIIVPLIERMDACEYSLEIIIVPLKKE